MLRFMDDVGAERTVSESKTSAPRAMRLVRCLFALSTPFVAVALQLLALPVTSHVWFLFFFPAVFASSWIGGLRSGLVATAISAVLVLWFIVPPQHSLIKPAGFYFPLVVFAMMGVLFAVFHDRLITAKRRAIEALSASELANEALTKTLQERRVFAALIDNSSDFIGIADANGKPIYLNPAGRRMVGLEPDQMVEKTEIPDYYPPEERAFVSDVIVKSMVENGRWQGETYFRNWKTGESIPVSDTHFLIRDPDTNQVLGMGTVTRDISDIRRARDELQKANEAVRGLVEQAPDGIFVADLDGRYIDVNRAGCRMLGYERAELIGSSIVDLIREEDIPRLLRSKAQLLEGEIQLEEWVLRKKDGTFLPVELSAIIFPDGRWQAVVRDISERRRLEAALHASHVDLVRAQSVAHVGSWRLDAQRDLVSFSDEAYRMFGIAPGTPMTSTAFLGCTYPEDRARVEEAWEAALSSRSYDIEHRIVRGDEVRWVREKADLEFDENDTLVGGIGITLDITDRKRREEELRRTQERLERALRGAELATWDWNIVTGEVVFNARWAEMRGYRLDEVQGNVDTWSSGVHPDDWPNVRHVLDEHFEGRRSDYETEHRARTKSGEWIWILDRGKVAARNERGEPVRMAGTELDITVRKQAQEALRVAEARSSGILSISADALLTIDDDQRITMFNDGAEKIFGYSKDEAIGAPLEILIPEHSRAAHRKHVARFAAGARAARRMGEPGHRISGLRKNGEEFPADAAISKLEVGGERILSVALRDVTEQTRVEDEQRFLAKIGEIFASTLDPTETLTRVATAAVEFLAAFVVVDLVEGTALRRAKVAYADPANAELAAVLEARTPEDPLWIRAAIESRHTQVLAPTDEELEVDSPDARAHALHAAMRARSVMFVPLIVRDTVVGVMSFVSIPDAAYAASDVRLAEEVARRAALAIENSRLYRLAQDAIAARDDVLGIVAHDLRNPLNTIVLHASLLCELEGRYLRPAEAITRAATRMNRLIQDLLDVTKIEAGRLSIERDRVRTPQVVADAIEAQRPLAAPASLELHADLSPDLPEVWADRDRLLQVFENLIGNAMKFTGRGGRITIGATQRADEVLFSVADTGAGIAPEDIPYLFDRFWQARNKGRAGAGLGLPIVKGIVEAHGGRIWIESALGRGSTVFFTIPAAPRAEVSRDEQALHGH